MEHFIEPDNDEYSPYQPRNSLKKGLIAVGIMATICIGFYFAPWLLIAYFAGIATHAYWHDELNHDS